MFKIPVWRTQHIGTTVHFYETVDSTQRIARQLIAEGRARGALVIAHTQTAGRGRLGRAWHSPRGNLYLSYVLQPTLPLALWSQYTMMTALALADAIQSVIGLSAALKWPNDALIEQHKVAGILAETCDDQLIIGVGVNVNAELPSELTTATSLHHAVGHEVDMMELLRVFIERTDALYVASLHGERFDARWAARLHTLGQYVQVQFGERTIVGYAERVETDGALVVRCDDGSRMTCHAGEVTLGV
jgi:BirA family biotin operon repressor/biotin-[acetyl-CoA-carboxylase] ligase